LRASCLGITKKTAREGARHNLAPGSARGNLNEGRLRGREGGRYNRREAIALPISAEISPPSIPALVVAAFAATNIGGIRSFPGPSPGLGCGARLRARAHKAPHFARSNLCAVRNAG